MCRSDSQADVGHGLFGSDAMIHAGQRPCMLGHTQSPRMHFVALQPVVPAESPNDQAATSLPSWPRMQCRARDSAFLSDPEGKCDTMCDESGCGLLRLRGGADTAAGPAVAARTPKNARLSESPKAPCCSSCSMPCRCRTPARCADYRDKRASHFCVPLSGATAIYRFLTSAPVCILASPGAFEPCGLPGPCAS